MRILFVENHEVFAATVRKQFLASHEVTVVPSIQVAEEELCSTPFDVVLVDYHLDDGEGTEVVSLARRVQPAALIIAVSSQDRGNEALFEAGADSTCPKMEFPKIVPILEEHTSSVSRSAGHELIGATLEGVFWSRSGEAGYARYFLLTEDGRWFELSLGGVLGCEPPVDAVDLAAWDEARDQPPFQATTEGWTPAEEPGPEATQASKLRAILGRARVADVRGTYEDLVILMGTGEVLHMFNTWDGEHGGNNLVVETTQEAAKWSDERLRMRRLA